MRPTAISGQLCPVNHTAAAAISTPTLEITSFREHSKVLRMFTTRSFGAQHGDEAGEDGEQCDADVKRNDGQEDRQGGWDDDAGNHSDLLAHELLKRDRASTSSDRRRRPELTVPYNC
jgi:hypothetical protein